MEKIKQGQSVFLYNHRSGNISEHIIDSVGRKYFTARRTKFFIEDLREVTDYTSELTVFLSMDDYNDWCERRKILSEIQIFRFGELTLDELRAIRKILINE